MNGETTGSLAPRELNRTDGDRVPGPRRDPDSSSPAAGRDPRRGASRSVGWIWGTAFALFVLYAVAGIRDHLTLGTVGFDLGVFEQDVRGWAGLHWPTSDIVGPDAPRLGNHFSPILALLAPFYAVFSTPVTLIVAQAALIAVGVVPIATWAQRVLGRNTAAVVAASYGLSWGIAHAVEFSFHEVAFAVPLLAFSACALGQGRAAAAVAWALPLLLVKEDMGLTVIVVGLLVWFHLKCRSLGVFAIAAGVFGMAVARLVMAANAGSTYDRSGTVTLDHGSFGANLEHMTVGMLNPESKPQLLILLFAVTGFLALRSPLVLLAVPTLGWRLYSDHWPYFSGHYHYNLVLMPILFAALVHALVKLRGAQGAQMRTFGLQMCAVSTALLLPSSFLVSPLRPSTWEPQPRVADARAVMAQLPDDAVVGTSNNLAPHLTARAEVSIWGYTPSDPDWILVDRAAWPWPYGSWDKQEAALAAARTAGFRDVAARGDFVLLHRAAAVAAGTVEPRPAGPPVKAPAGPRIERPAVARG